jgi:hypothetical protein
VALKPKALKNQLTLFVSSKFEQGVDAQCDTKAPISHDSHRIQASQELHLYFVQKPAPADRY